MPTEILLLFLPEKFGQGPWEDDDGEYRNEKTDTRLSPPAPEMSPAASAIASLVPPPPSGSPAPRCVCRSLALLEWPPRSRSPPLCSLKPSCVGLALIPSFSRVRVCVQNPC